ncbi:hypothetical protein AwDysgo_13440 [Bacteroidales bacterium]|nr:hypothetical protein AwDysgo_13440 [Bacteroidales bacterium]
MKKENTGTYVSVNEFGALTTGFLNGNISVKTIFDKSELSLEYNLNWRDYTQRWSRENEFFYFPNDTLNYDKRGREAPFGYLSQNINLTYTFPQSLFVFISSMNLMPQKNSLKMGS